LVCSRCASGIAVGFVSTLFVSDTSYANVNSFVGVDGISLAYRSAWKLETFVVSVAFYASSIDVPAYFSSAADNTAIGTLEIGAFGIAVGIVSAVGVTDASLTSVRIWVTEGFCSIIELATLIIVVTFCASTVGSTSWLQWVFALAFIIGYAFTANTSV